MENYMTKQEFINLFGNISVGAESVADFLAKYYKQERYTGRGESYAKCLLESYEREFKMLGYTHISKHDSATGSNVAYFG